MFFKPFHRVLPEVSSHVSAPNYPDLSPQVSAIVVSQPFYYPKAPKVAHIIFFLHINLSLVLANSQLLLFAHPPYLPIMLLISYGRCRSKKEGACYHCDDKWQTKEGKRVL